MRKSIDKKSLSEICERFIDVSENHLELNMRTLAERLGYQNQSTLTKVRKHEGFIGPDKLELFGKLTNENGERPNINFIIMGEGPTFIGCRPSIFEVNITKEIETLSKQLVDKLGAQKAKELLRIIVEST